LVATQLIKRKGIHYLIRAIPEITAKHSDIVCVVAGSGDYINELLALVDELDLRTYVHFVGTLNGQELASAYRSAEVFVLPSLGEGQPTCILEAWAFSKPVVATNIEGIVDYYDGTALLTEPGDTKDGG
jgi:glycosyltransferase involved in cell wall biosynthesis